MLVAKITPENINLHTWVGEMTKREDTIQNKYFGEILKFILSDLFDRGKTFTKSDYRCLTQWYKQLFGRKMGNLAFWSNTKECKYLMTFKQYKGKYKRTDFERLEAKTDMFFVTDHSDCFTLEPDCAVIKNKIDRMYAELEELTKYDQECRVAYKEMVRRANLKNRVV